MITPVVPQPPGQRWLGRCGGTVAGGWSAGRRPGGSRGGRPLAARLAARPGEPDGLPTVYAAPCTRQPVDEIRVLAESPDLPAGAQDRAVDQGTVVWQLVRLPGTGVRTRFPLGETVPGYREAGNRPVSALAAAYRGRPSRPPVSYLVRIQYRNGSVDRWTLGSAGVTPGSLHLPTWGEPTLEQFAKDASTTSPCLTWAEDPINALGLSLLGWPLLALALVVWSARRGRFTHALVGQALSTS